MIMQAPGRRDDEVAAMHLDLFAVHDRLSALALHDESEGRSGVPMSGCNLAGQYQLHTGIPRGAQAPLRPMRYETASMPSKFETTKRAVHLSIGRSRCFRPTWTAHLASRASITASELLQRRTPLQTQWVERPQATAVRNRHHVPLPTRFKPRATLPPKPRLSVISGLGTVETRERYIIIPLNRGFCRL
jgi:hypothetical protein